MIGICHRDGVRASVTRVYCGVTREPIELIFGRYLPLVRVAYPKGALSSQEMEFWGPAILGYLGRYRPTLCKLCNRD